MSDAGTLPLISPLTGEPLAPVPHASEDEVRAAVARARAAQPAWAALPVRQRARPLVRFHDLVLDRPAEVMDRIQLETGKARFDAYEEVADCALVARYYAYHARRHLAGGGRRGVIPALTRTRVAHRPWGVVGIIAPWNYPLVLAVTDALPALMAGNAVVLKPDVRTARTALLASDLLREAGLPTGLFDVVNGEGAAVGPVLIGTVDFVAFTGSTETGRIVARQCADRLIGCSLELGGKNPLIVLDDADLDRAVDGAVKACFSMAGQLCIAAERILVQAGVAEDFTRRLVDRVGAMRIGVSRRWDLEMGSLISAEQLDRVRAHLDDAVARGARVLTGGRHRPDLGPFVFEPTLLADVPEDAALHDQETFGPVVALYSFRDDDQAARLANASRYGLNASIWSRDVRRARRLAARIEAGTVNINDHYAATWGSTDAPMGGFKDSGLGRRHGREGILKYTQPQTIAVQRALDLRPSPRLPARRFARLFTAALRIVRRLPTLR